VIIRLKKPEGHGDCLKQVIKSFSKSFCKLLTISKDFITWLTKSRDNPAKKAGRSRRLPEASDKVVFEIFLQAAYHFERLYHLAYKEP